MPLADRLKARLDDPRLFTLVQRLVSGRQLATRRWLARELALRPGEPLLDVCCGTGQFATVTRGPYLGLDLNARYIAYARHHYGAGAGHPERRFLAADIRTAAWSTAARGCAKAMMVNSMHHLSDEETAQVLAQVARVATTRLVIIDMDPTPGNPVSDLVARQDRGGYLRSIEAQRALASRYFSVEYCDTFFDGLCGQTVLICAPGEALHGDWS